MKDTFKKLTPIVLAPALAALCVCLFRRLTLWAFGRLFSVWNLHQGTYAYAGAFARGIADAAGSISGFVSLLAVCIGLSLVFKRHAFDRKAGVCCVLPYALAGALSSCLMMGVLFAAGSVRMSEYRAVPAPSEVIYLANGALACTGIALCARIMARGVKMAVSGKVGRIAAYAVSGAVQSVLCLLLYGGFSFMLALNGFLSGILFFRMYERYGNILPEAGFAVSFFLFPRLAFGFPDWAMGAYTVSEDWLTGGGSGLEMSGILFAALAACLLICFAGKSVSKWIQSHVLRIR